MGEDDRYEWISAAYRAIGHYPLDLLKRGAAVALRVADHPSKIIPAITAEVEPALARQRESAALAARWSARTALPAPGGERCTKTERDAICKHHGVGRYSKAETLPGRAQPLSIDLDRPCRTPTRADYIRLGVDPATLDGMGVSA